MQPDRQQVADAGDSESLGVIYPLSEESFIVSHSSLQEKAVPPSREPAEQGPRAARTQNILHANVKGNNSLSGILLGLL